MKIIKPQRHGHTIVNSLIIFFQHIGVGLRALVVAEELHLTSVNVDRVFTREY